RLSLFKLDRFGLALRARSLAFMRQRIALHLRRLAALLQRRAALLCDGGLCTSAVLFSQTQECVLWRRPSAGQHLQLVGLVEAQGEGVAACVPFPSAKRDEACAACELLPVISDDVCGLPARNEPPDDDRLRGSFRVARSDLEDEKWRLFRAAMLADLKAARDAHVEFERRLRAFA